MAQKIKSFSSEPKIECGKIFKTTFECEGVSYHHEVKWLRKDHFTFRQGLFVLHSGVLLEIKNIFVIDDDFLLRCTKYSFVEFDQFTNSVKIQKFLPELHTTVKLSSLNNEQLLEKKNINGEYYVIIENLDIENAFKSSQ